MSASASNKRQLSAYLKDVSGVISDVFSAPQWVVAEIHDFVRKSNGHCHVGLIESASGVEIAKCQAVMFSSTATIQIQAFKQATGLAPSTGMKVLAQVSAAFNERFGFQLQLHALDASYTLGDMQASMDAAIARLKAEGWYGAQKKLPAPTRFNRIAVISPEAAAGLGDFQQEAHALEQFGLTQFRYYSATFQGKPAADSIKTAMRAWFTDHQQQPFDALCIIRGGGAKADLAWLSDYSLALWVCRAPVPVLTGIGHERDTTLLDHVAHRAFDTPSKVVGFIAQAICREASETSASIERIKVLIANQHSAAEAFVAQAKLKSHSRAQQCLNQSERRLRDLVTACMTKAGAVLASAAQSLEVQSARSRLLAVGITGTQQAELQHQRQRLMLALQTTIATQQQRLSHDKALLKLHEPQAVLRRGYALVYAGGRIIKSVGDLANNTAITVRLSDGTVRAETQQESSNHDH